MNWEKLMALSVGSSLGSVAAAGNKIGGCVTDVGGVDGDMAVSGVAVAAGFDVVVFFADFLLERALKPRRTHAKSYEISC